MPSILLPFFLLPSYPYLLSSLRILPSPSDYQVFFFLILPLALPVKRSLQVALASRVIEDVVADVVMREDVVRRQDVVMSEDIEYGDGAGCSDASACGPKADAEDLYNVA